MKIRECNRGQIYDIGFVDCNFIHEQTVQQKSKVTLENLEEALTYFANRSQILFPYNFE